MSRFEQTEKELKFLDALEKLRSLKDGTSATIPISHIVLTQNIRSKIDKSGPDFIQLKESIKETGLLQPPVVTILPDEILCIAGHRRIEALKELGHQRVSVIIRKLDEKDTQTLAQLVENTARKDISPIDLAKAVSIAKSSNKYSASRLGELIGKERKYIERLIRISNWSSEAKSLAEKYRLTLKQLFAISSKSLSDSEIVHEIKLRAGIVKPTKRKGASISSSNKKRLTDYFAKNNLSNSEKDTIYNFLINMGINGWKPEKKDTT